MSKVTIAWQDAHRAFARDERGSFTVLSLFLMITVMLVAGIAIDVVRYEARRTKVQNTLDRAILAAADMNQTRTPAQVVHDYFEAAGLIDYYADPTVDTSHGYKSVSATATGMLDTFFMNMLGITQLQTVSSGTAEESISDIEISLVLDVSGSMNEEVTYQVYEAYRTRYGSTRYRWNTYSTGKTKLETLQDAAKEFVGTVFGTSSNARTSMSIVPYATEVSLPQALWNRYNIPVRHGFSRCVDFDSGDYNSASISTTSPLHQTDHLDPWYNSSPPTLLVCRPESATEVLPLGDDPDTIKTMIGNLTADGNTSIELGMKWGTALLDPAAQTVVTGMIADNAVSTNFAGRPYAYTDGQTMKVIVVMTDGHNTDQYELKSPYQTGFSDVWKWTDGSGKVWYSVNYPEGNNNDVDGDGVKNEGYWIEGYSDWSCGYHNNYTCRDANRWMTTPKGGALAVRLTWPQVWNEMSVRAQAYTLRYPILYSSSYRDTFLNADQVRVNASAKDSRLNAICDSAKAQGIIVFAIGFAVTSTDGNKLKACASSDAHYYDVQGLEITTAFQSIANAIGKLRLTQ